MSSFIQFELSPRIAGFLMRVQSSCLHDLPPQKRQVKEFLFSTLAFTCNFLGDIVDLSLLCSLD
jgi:hypothetical protein